MRSVDTIGRAMFANSKTPSSGLSRSKPEKNCARNCRSNAQKHEPPRLELAAVFLWEEFCPMESIWRNMSPTSRVGCCKMRWRNSKEAKLAQQICSKFHTDLSHM